MKRKFRIFISIVLMFSLLMMLGTSAAAFASDTTQLIVDEYVKAMEAVQSEVESNSTTERRAIETASTLQAAQIKNSLSSQKWYGGQYIDGNGRLHVVVTDIDMGAKAVAEASVLTPATLSKVDSASVKTSPSVKIEIGEYSLNELKAIMMLIAEINPEYVYGCGIDEEKNCVFVELSTCDDSTVSKFKESVIDSPAVTYVQSQGKALPMATLYAGSVVWPTSGSRVTISTFGYKNEEFGFVTVGHTLGDTIKTSSNGSILGTTSSSNKVINSTADGSWTKLNSGHTGMDGVAKIGSTNTNFGYFEAGDYDPVQGSSVSAYLGRSATVDTGNITSVYYRYTCAYSALNSSWNDIQCYDIRVSGIDSQGGDSGAPLLGYASGVSGNVLWGSLRSGSNGYANFCNINSVVDALGVECVGG